MAWRAFIFAWTSLMASLLATARLCVPRRCLAYLYMRLSAPSPVPESISSNRFSYGNRPGNLAHDLLDDDVALARSALAVLRSLRFRELGGFKVLHDSGRSHGFMCLAFYGLNARAGGFFGCWRRERLARDCYGL